ncbi:MAG: AAA family ATPase, partial [Actinomycetes bacterium]
RRAFADQFRLLWVAAGRPTLATMEKMAEAGGVGGSPTRQRISEWRRGHLPARFDPLAALLTPLIADARATAPRPPVPGLYDRGAWRTWWEDARQCPPDSTPCGRRTRTHRAGVSPARSTQNGHTQNGHTQDGQVQHGQVPSPYPGLEAFKAPRPGQPAYFYGRDDITVAVVARLDAAARTGGLVALVGASGAGKSSLLRAGLVPAVRSGGLSTPGSHGWPIVIITPGEDPVAQLIGHVPGLAEVFTISPPRQDATERGATLAAAADSGSITAAGTTEPETPTTSEPSGEEFGEARRARFGVAVRAVFTGYAEQRAGAGAQLLLVIDQFEELFTLCEDDCCRRVFLDTVRAACTPPAQGEVPAALVVFAVRADFVERCAEDSPDLLAAVQDRQIFLGRMTNPQLREAISRPAQKVGLT